MATYSNSAPSLADIADVADLVPGPDLAGVPVLTPELLADLSVPMVEDVAADLPTAADLMADEERARRASTAAGKLAKSRAHAILRAHRAPYILRGQHLLLRRLLDNGTGAVDDIVEGIAAPKSAGTKWRGAIPGPLKVARIMARDGHRPTHRPEGHGREITVWRVLDRDRALAWLAAHPLPPEEGGKRDQ